MKGINKVQLIGYVGADPKSSNGVTSFSVATSDSYTDKEGNKVEKTEWHKISAFQKLGEIAMSYLKKGSLVYVEGKLHYGKWEDKNKTTHHTAEIHLRELNILKSEAAPQEKEMPPLQPDPYTTIDQDVPF